MGDFAVDRRIALCADEDYVSLVWVLNTCILYYVVLCYYLKQGI